MPGDGQDPADVVVTCAGGITLPPLSVLLARTDDPGKDPDGQ